MKERIAAKLTKSKAPNNVSPSKSQSSNNVDLIKQFERKINNNSDEFGPPLPPKVIENNVSDSVDLRRSVIINQGKKNNDDSSSPVPTDGEEEEDEDQAEFSKESSKREVVPAVTTSVRQPEYVPEPNVSDKKEANSTKELPNKKSLLEKTEKSSAEVGLPCFRYNIVNL